MSDFANGWRPMTSEEKSTVAVLLAGKNPGERTIRAAMDRAQCIAIDCYISPDHCYRGRLGLVIWLPGPEDALQASEFVTLAALDGIKPFLIN